MRDISKKMESKNYSKIKLKNSTFKIAIIKMVFNLLAKSLEIVSKIDPEIQKELSVLPNGFTLKFTILPDTDIFIMQKHDNFIKLSDQKTNSTNLTISFKNIESAFLLSTVRLGTMQANAERRLCVQGDTALAMVLIRCLNKVQSLLFPRIIAKRVLKRVPRLTLKTLLLRIKLYTKIIFQRIS